MDPHFLTKVYFVSHSEKNIVKFKNFCVQLYKQADCTKEECDIRTFTNLLSSFLDNPENYVKERAEFFTSHCKLFQKTFIVLFNMSQDKQYCIYLIQLLKEKSSSN